MDKFCPARMICKEDNEGIVTVSYCQTHNHNTDFIETKYHPIPKSTLELIKQMLLLGASVEYIYRLLREGKATRNNRGKTDDIQKKHAISKRQIRGIAHKLKLNKHMHTNDAMSLSLLVQSYQDDSDYNPILLYKPEGATDFVIGPEDIGNYKIDKEDFLVAIQTKEQLDMLQKQSRSKIICLDSTHCTNKYNFKLITMVVPDEFGKGYPVGHLISNKENEAMLHTFFDAIEQKCGVDFYVNALMTDDDNAEWSAFNKVFGDKVPPESNFEKVPHLLCKWHVHRSWRRKLHQLLPHDRNLQLELYLASIVLMEEPNKDTFRDMAEKFKSEYKNVCELYVTYFENYYLTRPEKWAMCYRQFSHANTDTNMYVESFHNRLKTFYMKRRFNRRIDDLVILLLEIEEDDYYDNLLNVKSKKQVRTDDLRHKRGMRISNDDIYRIDAYKWLMKSQTSAADIHEIALVRPDCFDDFCYNHCHEISCIGLCSHMYQCSCLDSSNLCKHIHKVHSDRVKDFEVPRFVTSDFRERLIPTKDQDSFETSEVEDNIDNDITTEESITYHDTEIAQPDYCTQLKISRAVQALDDIREYLDDETLRKLGLSQICNDIEQLCLKCKALKCSDQIIQENFKSAQNIAPNSKQSKVASKKRIVVNPFAKRKKIVRKNKNNPIVTIMGINDMTQKLKGATIEKSIEHFSSEDSPPSKKIIIDKEASHIPNSFTEDNDEPLEVNRVVKKTRTTSKTIDIDEDANTRQNHPGYYKKKLGNKRKRQTSNTLNNISNNSSNYSGRDMNDGSVFVDSKYKCNLLSRRETIIKNPEIDKKHSDEIIMINDLSFCQL